MTSKVEFRLCLEPIGDRYAWGLYQAGALLGTTALSVTTATPEVVWALAERLFGEGR